MIVDISDRTHLCKEITKDYEALANKCNLIRKKLKKKLLESLNLRMIFLIIKMVLVIKYLRVKLFGQFFIKYIKTHQLKILDLYVFTNTLRIEKVFTLF